MSEWRSSELDSTTELEYSAAVEAAKEAVWIKKFLTELGIVPSVLEGIELFCDNNGAIAQAKEPRSNDKSKHVMRKYYLTREIVDRNDVKICKVHTDENVADPLTKPLPQPKHERHARAVGLKQVLE